MARAITLFTGQWADMPLERLAEKASAWGYDGLELICLGDHLDPDKAAGDRSYCEKQLKILDRHHLKLFAINNAIAGQLVCDPNSDARSDKFAPPHCAGSPEKKRAWAVEAMKTTARAARNLGVKTVAGFTGSSIWHLLYSFPPVPDETIEAGFRYFAEM
jgi:sugar phosphate isomerase/epimerase